MKEFKATLMGTIKYPKEPIETFLLDTDRMKIISLHTTVRGADQAGRARNHNYFVVTCKEELWIFQQKELELLYITLTKTGDRELPPFRDNADRAERCWHIMTNLKLKPQEEKQSMEGETGTGQVVATGGTAAATPKATAPSPTAKPTKEKAAVKKTTTKKAATKKAAAKAKKPNTAPGKRAPAGTGIGDYAYELIAVKKKDDTDEILNAIKKKFPKAKTSRACVAGYKQMVKNGWKPKSKKAK